MPDPAERGIVPGLSGPPRLTAGPLEERLEMSHLVPRRVAIGIAAVAIGLFGAGGAFAGDDPQPIAFTHNVIDAPAPVNSAVFGTDGSLKPGQKLCQTSTQANLSLNVNTDCSEGSVGPHNETSIAVNPTTTDPDHLNMIGGANDYQLALNSGGHVTETVLSRAHVTFDSGHTWAMYPIVCCARVGR